MSAEARAAATGEAVEVVSETTERSRVFANPDGTRTLETRPQPVRVKKNGDWTAVDTSLHKRTDGGVEAKATTADVVFSGGGADAPLVRMAKGDKNIALSWPKTLPIPTLAGDTATYAEVEPGIDLVVHAKPEGFSQVLVVKNKEAAKNSVLQRVKFGARTEGLKLGKDEAGNPKVTDDNGNDVFTSASPLMWDSSSEDEKSTTKGPASGAKRAFMETAVAADAVEVIPDQALENAVGAVKSFLKQQQWAKNLLGRAREALSRRPSCLDGNSFTPETQVLMADGSRKPLAEVNVGDMVLATDPETGRTEAKTVARVIIGEGYKNLVEVTVDIDGAAGSATEEITATDGHPFWLPAEQRWAKASELIARKDLLAADGDHLQVTAAQRWAEKAQVYNLTVEGIHTYYVLAGNTPVLVHNCGGVADTPDLVPDDAVVVRGGTSDMPGSGVPFSGSFENTIEEAGAGVPHGQIRVTTAGEIRRGGGAVEYAPEPTRGGNMNDRHVNVCVGQGSCPFGPLVPNPVPKADRIK